MCVAPLAWYGPALRSPLLTGQRHEGVAIPPLSVKVGSCVALARRPPVLPQERPDRDWLPLVEVGHGIGQDGFQTSPSTSVNRPMQ
jgi:hypothetical protein